METNDAAATDWTAHFAHRARAMRRSEVRELLKLIERPEIISFAGGVPDPALFPVGTLKSAYDEILRDPALAARALQYGASEGWTPLRERIVALMAAKGVRCDVENVLITNGAQQAIEFSAKLFVEPGADIFIQSPTYLGALQAFTPYDPRYVMLPEPGQNELDPRLSRGPSSSGMAYVMADFRNPTGQSLSIAEREDLLALADRLDLPVVEDDPYGEIYFDSEPLPSLTAIGLDGRHVDTGRVLYCGTFSKTLAPGLRVGWVVAPRQIVDQMVLLKQGADIQVSTMNQMAVASLLDRLPTARLGEMRDVYRGRRDAMLDALDRHLPKAEGYAWTRPSGGLFVWLELPPALNAAALLPAAIAMGVAFVPGEAFHPDRSGANTLRLSYSLADHAAIDSGVERLANLLRREV